VARAQSSIQASNRHIARARALIDESSRWAYLALKRSTAEYLAFAPDPIRVYPRRAALSVSTLPLAERPGWTGAARLHVRHRPGSAGCPLVERAPCASRLFQPWGANSPRAVWAGRERLGRSQPKEAVANDDFKRVAAVGDEQADLADASTEVAMP
jgi:hypothetical protein